MARIPVIHTWRLKLRPFTLEDAASVQRLAGDPDVAATLPRLPHPYLDGLAEKWIGTHAESAARNEDLIFAVTLRETGELIGAIELAMNLDEQSGSLGYWVGKPYWNSGYCTEAARAVVRLAFTHLGLHRVAATHLAGNVGSGRVMQKVGMTREGVRRQAVKLGERFVDRVEYGIVKGELPPSALTAAFTCVYVQPQREAAAAV